MGRHFPMIIEQDSDGVYIVECPSLKGCRSYGHSIEDGDGQYSGSYGGIFGGNAATG